jgi:hypothetical protein
MESNEQFSRVVETDGEAWVCVGQLIVNRFTEGEGLIVANNLCVNLNMAYEERRKSAEKDFRELLELADRLKFSGSYFPDGLEDEFDAWKKARGLE